eukprot:GHVU01026514.1.p1 GENE.GHVU01026514.1~~GHVU01026514.1.p1  ORF type:complete len:343 (-),score=55.66 GHVU01026514.1:992-1879(-)
MGEFVDFSLTRASPYYREELLLPPEEVRDWSTFTYDIVTATSTASTTCTKGYSKNTGRAGPVVSMGVVQLEEDAACASSVAAHSAKTISSATASTPLPATKGGAKGGGESLYEGMSVQAPTGAAPPTGCSSPRDPPSDVRLDAAEGSGNPCRAPLHEAGEVRRTPEQEQRHTEEEDESTIPGDDEADPVHVYDTKSLDPQRFRLAKDGELLRRLTPRELLRLNGFPESFHFPSSVTLTQRYCLIGNSVSVFVVEHLLARLLGFRLTATALPPGCGQPLPSAEKPSSERTLQSDMA